MTSIKLLEIHAREKEQLPENWYAWLFEVKECPLGRYFEVTGAVCPLKTRGKNKGEPNWSKKDKTTIKLVQIGADAHNKWVEEWEKKNNSCSECMGTGKVLVAWNIDTGSTYEPCKCGRNTPEIQNEDTQINLSLPVG